MKCKNCGNPLKEGNDYCTQCGKAINESIYEDSHRTIKKVFIIIIIACLFGAIITIVVNISNKNSNKLICKSNNGKVTIYYDENGITGNSTTNFKYEYSDEKKRAQELGIHEYLNQYKTWFENTTNGECQYEYKEVSK